MTCFFHKFGLSILTRDFSRSFKFKIQYSEYRAESITSLKSSERALKHKTNEKGKRRRSFKPVI